MSEFYDSREFEKLPDEFNRDYKEAAPPVQKKKNLLSLLISFVASTMLIFPLTITGDNHGGATGRIDDPEPGPAPGPGPVVVEYDIVGQWNNEDEYYEFFEDGNGFWTDGNLFVLLNWEKSGNDYQIYGEGLFQFDATTLSYGIIDMLTLYDNGSLMLQKHKGENSYMTAYFSRSNREFDLTNITPLFGKEGKDRFEGVWINEQHLEGAEEGKYVEVSSIEFQDDKMASFNLASIISDRWALYVMDYVHDVERPNIKVIIGDGSKIYFEEFPAANTTYTYEAYELYVYRFIDTEGEGLFVTGMNQNVLRKYVWEEPGR